MIISGGGITIPGRPFAAGAAGPPPFDGNFASLFPGAYQVVQADKGLQYGAVMRAAAGNTSSVAFALTGATPTVPVPIWIRITAAGLGDVYYDGLGVTPAMVGVTIADSVNIVLTGAGAGMAITPGVGSQIAGDTWKATCSALADQSGNAKPYAQVTPARQPIVTIGINGKPGLLFDGVDDFMKSALALQPQGTEPVCFFMVLRRPTTTAGNARVLVGEFDEYPQVVISGATQMLTYAGGASGNFANGLPTNVWGALDGLFSDSTADYFQTGSGPIAAGVNCGAGTGGIRCISNSTVPASMELLMLGYAPQAAFDRGAFRAAVNDPAAYGPGAIAV